MLQIECTRCARKGRYSVAKLLVEHGHRGNMSKWVSDLRGDCPKRNAAHLNERCDLICPDLPKARYCPNFRGTVLSGGAELEPYQMLSASSITMPIPITSTASAIES